MNKLTCSICSLEIKDGQTIMKTLDDENKIKEAWHEQCFYGKRSIEAFVKTQDCYCDKSCLEESTTKALRDLAIKDADPQEAKK